MTWFATDENGTYRITGVPPWTVPTCPDLDLRFNGTEDDEELEKIYEQLWYRNIEDRPEDFNVSGTTMVVDIEARPINDALALQFTIDKNLAGSALSDYHQLSVTYPYSSGTRTRYYLFGDTTIGDGLNDLGLLPKEG